MVLVLLANFVERHYTNVVSIVLYWLIDWLMECAMWHVTRTLTGETLVLLAKTAVSIPTTFFSNKDVAVLTECCTPGLMSAVSVIVSYDRDALS